MDDIYIFIYMSGFTWQNKVTFTHQLLCIIVSIRVCPLKCRYSI